MDTRDAVKKKNRRSQRCAGGDLLIVIRSDSMTISDIGENPDGYKVCELLELAMRKTGRTDLLGG
jgi:hypothetical protein